jgi:hypothetical protein
LALWAARCRQHDIPFFNPQQPAGNVGRAKLPPPFASQPTDTRQIIGPRVGLWPIATPATAVSSIQSQNKRAPTALPTRPPRARLATQLASQATPGFAMPYLSPYAHPPPVNRSSPQSRTASVEPGGPSRTYPLAKAPLQGRGRYLQSAPARKRPRSSSAPGPANGTVVR